MHPYTHLEVPLADRRRLTMTVNISPGCEMFQSHEVSILDKVNDGIRVSVVRRLLIPFLDEEQVVLILVGVGGHLLLLGSQSLGIQVEVGVEISSTRPVILERHRCSIRHFSRHGGIVKTVALQ